MNAADTTTTVARREIEGMPVKGNQLATPDRMTDT
jgi:hypothetical protein